jgi:hypothetical protein
MRFKIILVTLLCAAQLTAESRPRLIVLTDFFKDPDDKQSLIRLLTYANEFEIEGIVATSLAFGDGSVRPELIREVIGDYGKVLGSLRRHEQKGFEYPAAEALARVVKAGAPVVRKFAGRNKGFPAPYPPGARDSRVCDPAEKWIGPGKDTAASRHIIEVVDRKDARPVWVTIWGGAMDLAQALWRVRSERTPEEAKRFVGKLRVYQISWQDTGAVWIWNNVPDLFLILNSESMRGFYAEGPAALRDAAWVDANVRSRGALGAGYPEADVKGVKEGDTPSFLHLLARGLSDAEVPEWGGWGGRFRRLDDARRFYVSAADNHPESNDPERRKQWTVGRWIEAAANDFAARMTWCVKGFKEANHNPVVAIDGDAGTGVVRREVRAGQRVWLDAGKSSDRDGDAIDFHWWQYVEAGSFAETVPISDARLAKASFVAPKVARRETVHVVLAATDRGAPRLTSYRRVVFTVLP